MGLGKVKIEYSKIKQSKKLNKYRRCYVLADLNVYKSGFKYNIIFTNCTCKHIEHKAAHGLLPVKE